MRYLAIDLGDKRTGLAVGDRVTKIAVPLDVLEVPASRGDGAELVGAIVRAVGEQFGPQTPGELVVGLPLNMDGTEGPRAKLVRGLADKIAGATGRKVHLFDERLTTAEADWQMAGSGLTHKQKKLRRDAIAAANLLRGFLEQLGRPDPV